MRKEYADQATVLKDLLCPSSTAKIGRKLHLFCLSKYNKLTLGKMMADLSMGQSCINTWKELHFPSTQVIWMQHHFQTMCSPVWHSDRLDNCLGKPLIFKVWWSTISVGLSGQVWYANVTFAYQTTTRPKTASQKGNHGNSSTENPHTRTTLAWL